jgi:hypothetical protein
MGVKINAWGGTDKRGIYEFHCPGCGLAHAVSTRGEHAWTWNGSDESPTFTPSILSCGSDSERRCHSFVKDGRIQFLTDCYHNLAGQTVDLPDWKDV